MEHVTAQVVKRTQRDYSLAFKMSVVDDVEKGLLTYQEAQSKYGIQGRSTVLVWLRKHGQQDWTSQKMSKSQRQETPQQTIRRLEKLLAKEKVKTEFMHDVIDHMDRECGTNLRKKYLEYEQGLGKPQDD